MSSEFHQPPRNSPNEANEQRRNFLKQGIASTIGIGIIGSIHAGAQQGHGSSKLRISTPLKSQRIVSSKVLSEKPKKSWYSEVELIGKNDDKLIAQTYSTHIDAGDQYDSFFTTNYYFYNASADLSPAKMDSMTLHVRGSVGTINGNLRTDTITAISLSSSGISVDGPREQEVYILSPTADMSDQEVLDKMLKMDIPRK